MQTKMHSKAHDYKDVAGMVKNDIKAKIPRSQAGPSTNQFPTDFLCSHIRSGAMEGKGRERKRLPEIRTAVGAGAGAGKSARTAVICWSG